MKTVSTATYWDNPGEPPGYDADNNVQSRSTRQGDVISFAYDSLNRLCSKTYAASPVACGGSSANYLVTYAYDLDGRLIAANDNSAAVTLPGSAAQYAAAATYDQLNRPTNVSWSPAPAQATPAAASVSFDHQYDATNRRVGQSATDSSWWRYPGAGGSSRTGYTANNLNQYTAVGAASPTYDGDGNLQYDGTYHYCYDVESRLTAILSAGNCALPITTVAAYAYDAQGRRKAKTVGGTTTLYVTDADDREVLEYDGGSGAIGAWYSFAPAATLGPDAVLNRMDVVANSRQTLIPDIQGSIIGSLDSGGTLSKVGYEVYGENATLTTNGYFYTGRRLDPETAGSASQPSGLYYLRARAYSPAWGRFFQTDPIGYQGGNNLYAYTDNDPLNQTDPSGRCPACIGAVGGAIVGLAAQGISDVVRGNSFQWQNYAGAAAGGAVGGALLFTTLNPYAAGALASATQNATTQALNVVSGQQQHFNAVSFGVQTAVGGLTGGALGAAANAGAFPGLTNGFTSLSNQMLTKLGNGTISNMLPSTAAKTFIGQADQYAPAAVLTPATDAITDIATHSLK